MIVFYVSEILLATRRFLGSGIAEEVLDWQRVAPKRPVTWEGDSLCQNVCYSGGVGATIAPPATMLVATSTIGSHSPFATARWARKVKQPDERQHDWKT